MFHRSLQWCRSRPPIQESCFQATVVPPWPSVMSPPSADAGVMFFGDCSQRSSTFIFDLKSWCPVGAVVRRRPPTLSLCFATDRRRPLTQSICFPANAGVRLRHRVYVLLLTAVGLRRRVYVSRLAALGKCRSPPSSFDTESVFPASAVVCRRPSTQGKESMCRRLPPSALDTESILSG